MPAIPLPFVVALLLAVLCARMALRSERTVACAALPVLVGACAVQATLTGLRWAYHLPFAAMAQPILGSLLPAIAWVGLGGLQPGARPQLRAIWPHLIPPLAVTALVLARRPELDLALIGIFTGYGAALLWRARAGPDALAGVRIGDEAAARTVLAVVGLALIGSGVVEAMVAADFDFARGVHAAGIIAIADLVELGVVGYAAAVAEQSMPGPEPDAAQPNARGVAFAPDTAETDAEVLAAVDALMRQSRLWRDPNLTLNRLARRAGLPARRISGAVNRARGRNVSQMVNEHRVVEAARLLDETDQPVTAVLFEAGFQTKSNFNREFRRVMGVSPLEHRRRTRAGAGDLIRLAEAAPPESG